MKKFFGGLILVLLVGLLSACSSNNSQTGSNIISSVDLNDRENTILSSTTNQSFVFDFSNMDHQEVTVWMEKYESGKLVDDQLGFVTTEVDQSGSIVLATAKDIKEDKHQIYHIGVGDNNGTSSITVSDEKPKDLDTTSIVSGEMTEAKTLNDGEIVLATIAYSEDEFGTSSISKSFYEDPKTNMDELNKYNIVYLFKAEFIE